MAATVGAGAAKVLFERDLLVGFQFWFTTELVNYVVVLPLLLTAPPLAKWAASYRSVRLARSWRTINWFPVAALVVSALASVGIGGPGAFAYPMPALLWCAMTYPLFPTAVITFLLSVWEMIAISAGILPFPFVGDQLMGLMSIRLAIALIALGPIAVSITNEARNELLTQLHQLVNRDSLTGAMSRQAFIDACKAVLARGGSAEGTVALLMLDMDHFKCINDAYGHAAGDKALKAFAAKVLDVLGEPAVFGRLGGEEFAVLLQQNSAQQAHLIADRIRTAIEELAIAHEGHSFAISISGGIAVQSQGDRPTLEALLARADRALYLAKAAGRNRVVADDDTVVSRAETKPARTRRGIGKRA
jgi:diguanylate cyclase (GGDEF)-like protein